MDYTEMGEKIEALNAYIEAHHGEFFPLGHPFHRPGSRMPVTSLYDLWPLLKRRSKHAGARARTESFKAEDNDTQGG
jgi:hypothetical protein